MSIDISFKEKSQVIKMVLPKGKAHFVGDKVEIYFDLYDWNNFTQLPLTQEQANGLMFNDENPF